LLVIGLRVFQQAVRGLVVRGLVLCANVFIVVLVFVLVLTIAVDGALVSVATAVEQARGLAGRTVLLLPPSFSLVRRRLLSVPAVVRTIIIAVVISKEPSALARAALFRPFSSFVRVVHADSAAR
jgi:hypothetical protein